MKSKWRAIALMVILMASIVAGLYWHANSSPSTALNASDIPPPFVIGIYETDPSASVNIEADLLRSSNGVFVQVLLRPPTTGSILLLSTLQDSGGGFVAVVEQVTQGGCMGAQVERPAVRLAVPVSGGV